MNREHLIDRMVFSFGLEDESLYKEFSDRMSRMSRDGLADAIDRVLEEHSVDDVHLVIDRIEVDVGQVDMEDLQEVVKARVANALAARLEAMRKGDGETGFRTEDDRSRSERMLEFFILNGRLPWWAPSSGVRMKEVFRSVMGEPTPMARSLFAKARHNTLHLKRLLGLAEVDGLLHSWQRSGRQGGSASSYLTPALLNEAVRMVSPRFGKERAYGIVKYNLLASLMGDEPPADERPGERSLAAWLFRESPLTGLSDANRRYIEYTLRPLLTRPSSRTSSRTEVEEGEDGRRTTDERESKGISGKRRKSKVRRVLDERPATGRRHASDPMLSDFRTFLLSGRLDFFRSKSTGAEVNLIFRRLVRERIGELTGVIVSLGKSLRVRQRLLDNVSSRNIRRFFSEVVPGKRDLLEWLDSVYMETQEKVKPINQTNIRVQRSVDEITLEILTTTDINAISNETFLRMHLKRMALKHNIRYRDLLRAVFDAIARVRRLATNRFFTILEALQQEAFPERTKRRTSEGLETSEPSEVPSTVTADPRGGRTSTSDEAEAREKARGTDALQGDDSVTENLPKARYFLRYEGKSRKFRPWVEDASMEHWIRPSKKEDEAGTEKKTAGDAEGVSKEAARRDETVKPIASQEAARAVSGTREAEGEDAPSQRRPEVTASGGLMDEGEGLGDEFPQFSDRRGPLPMDLLYRLPKELVRRLIALKRTLLFGRNTKALQDLVTGYLRYVSDPMPYDEAAVPDLLRRIAAYLDVDEEFLRFALERGAEFKAEAILPAQRPSVAGGAYETETGIPVSENDADTLFERLSKQGPPASVLQARRMLDESLGIATMGRALFESVLRRLFPQEVGSLSETLEDAISKADRIFDAAMRSEVYKSFLSLALDPSNRPFDPDRIAAEALASAGADVRKSVDKPSSLTADELMTLLEGSRPQATAGQVLRLLDEAMGTAAMGRDLFESVLRRLMPQDARLVSEAMEEALTKTGRVVDSPMRSNAYKAFIASALDPSGTSIDPGLIVAEVTGTKGDARQEGAAPSALSAEELVAHLTKYRTHYSAYHVRMLLREAVGDASMGRALFDSVVRLLFTREARLVSETVEGILSSSYRVVDASMRSSVYKAFVAAALDPTNVPFDMNRVLSEVRRRVGFDRKEPFVMPARLSDAPMYFTPERSEGSRRRGKGASRRTRERGIILLYNILNLDVTLEEAGVNFFENISFSFELLLTRYRSRFLEILESNAYNAELSEFFAYSDDTRLFEQVRQLLPRSRTDRVTQSFSAATDILHRLRWIDLPRDEVRRFAFLDAYPLLFTATEGMPDVPEAVLSVLHRAAKAGLLKAEALADDTLPATVSELRRRLGAARFRQLLPKPGAQTSEELIRFLEEVRLVRDDTSIPTPRNEAVLIARLVASAAREGVFPEDHPLAGQKAEGHLGYIRDLLGRDEALARLVKGDVEPYVAATVAGWLEREQLMPALAHRYGVAATRLLPVLKGWLARMALTAAEERAFLERLLLAPVAARPTDRLAVFNRALLHSAMRDRYLSLGDGLEVLYGGGASTSDMRTGLTADFVVSGLRDASERWPEFYLGVLSSATIGNAMAYRVIDAWVGYFSGRPQGMTSDGVFRAVADVYLGNAFWHQRSQRRMHQLMLEGTEVLSEEKGEAARRTAAALLKVGVPADLLLEHAAMRRPDVLMEVEQAVRDRGIGVSALAEKVAARMSSVIGPAELTRYLMGVEDRSGRIPDLMRRWMEGKAWDADSARRFLRQLPERAAGRLIKSLSGPVDLERVILRWKAFLKASGLETDAQAAEERLQAAVIEGRLWKYASREYIHADLFRRLDIAGLLRRSKTSVTVDTIRASALPPSLFRRALAEEPADGWEDTDSLMEAWLSETQLTAETPAVRMDDPIRSVTVKGFGRIDADVLLFLESGRVAGQTVPTVGSSEFRSIIERVRAAGITLFLDLPVLHPRAAGLISAFFSRSEIVEHVFSLMAGATKDRVLLALLADTAERLSATAMSVESVLQLVRLHRRRFAGGRVTAISDVDGFLMEALRIPEFARAAAASAGVLRRQLPSVRGYRIARHLLERMARERAGLRPAFEQEFAHYLEKGSLTETSAYPGLKGIREELMNRMAAGDTLLRTLMYMHGGPASQRRRMLQLLGPGAERRLLAFIHPMLRSRLVVFAVLMKRHFGIDAWKTAGAVGESARLDLVLQWWSDARPKVTDPIEILRLFMEQAADALDRESMDRLRKASVARFSGVEKSLWMQLRSLVPAMVDLPPEKDRRLPTKEEVEKRAEREELEALDPEEGITVRNGGLVLLWPFLGRLFSRLQLTDGKVFLGEREQARAIQLTEYLVTGRKEMEEYGLSLNKVVCGAPLDFPVDPLLELTPEEEDVCQKMLLGVIRNWEKMKNTRPTTFQETFLRREARLYKLEDRWELTVERKAYDMLLETLPWNITMFQLNWMPQRMVVHWK